jgi:hypothetical protein
MALRKLERREWSFFFDRISYLLAGKRAEIEIDSPDVGSQIVARWQPLLGITYDPVRDTVEIMLDGFDHFVRHPRELYVDDPPLGWASLGMIGHDGVLEIVRLREPLMLSPPRELD